MASPQLYIIVVGCGRLGSHLANTLGREGHSLVVIDRDKQAFAALSVDFSGFQLEGDAVELAMLRQAKTGNADLVIASTSEDNVNLMVAQVAKTVFKVPRVLARVFDPKRERIYRELDIETVSPVALASDYILGLLAGGAGK
jgi:trk system potassium uptake protein TrkA